VEGKNLRLSDVIPDAEVLIALEPEELGLRILPVLSHREHNRRIMMSRLDLNGFLGAIANPTDHISYCEYPSNRMNDIELALREAWAWLEGAALLIPDAGFVEPHSLRILSRKADKLARETDIRRVFSARRIPKELLNPRIREDVWALYHRGKYDTAVFEAMKAVEVAVRDAADLTSADIGVKLMRKLRNPLIFETA
jgi:hypothetical protein